jgi:hypothetical protein
LGWRDAKDSGWRLVPGPGREHIVILTNLPLEEVGGWELCEIYKLRWTIELFFPVAKMPSAVSPLAGGERGCVAT